MLGILKNYIEKRTELLKLEMAENTSKAMSMAAYLLLLFVLMGGVLAFLWVGIALFLGYYLGNFAIGFLIMSGVLLLGLFLILSLKNRIMSYFKGKFIHTIFNEKK